MFKRIAASVLLVGGLMAATVLPASAHERRDVGNGQYTLTVGFLVEPAIQGYPNGVDFRVAKKSDSSPVEGVEKTLKVELQNGADKKPMDLRTVFGKPGSYATDFVPTKPGTYRFVFSGKINDATINETFESGPGRFSDVDAVSSVQFPAAPTDNGDSAAATTKITSAQAEAKAALDQANDTDKKVGTALIVAIAGVIVGLAGLGIGGVAMASRRRA